MAAKKKQTSKEVRPKEEPVVMETFKEEIKQTETNEWGGEKLDPAEEKLLDQILMGIVVFVLGWLALGILLSIKGLIWPS